MTYQPQYRAKVPAGWGAPPKGAIPDIPKGWQRDHETTPPGWMKTWGGDLWPGARFVFMSHLVDPITGFTHGRGFGDRVFTVEENGQAVCGNLRSWIFGPMRVYVKRDDWQHHKTAGAIENPGVLIVGPKKWAKAKAAELAGRARRAPRARKNPEPRARGRKVPARLVLLGAAFELVTDRGTIKGSGKWGLFSSPSGRELYMIRARRPALAAVPPGAKMAQAKNTWRKWSGFSVDGAIRFELPDAEAFLDQPIAGIEVIRYRSDKWTGKDTYYEHRFGRAVYGVANHETKPTAIVIAAKPSRVLVTARGIVG